jgi:hypothetical protein
VNILNKFGILFLTTITTAFVTSIVFLPALLYVMGPDEDYGKVFKCLYQRVKHGKLGKENGDLNE